jgi:hypothetical protein
MEIKISEEKLEKIIDVVFDGLGVDKYTSFQSRSINTQYIEFMTPSTRQNIISRYYPDLNLAVVNDEKFYDLVSDWVSSYKLYDIIKDDIIKRIYKVYSNRFKSRNYDEIRNIKYMSNMDFNKK